MLYDSDFSTGFARIGDPEVVVVYEDAQDQLLWLREPVVLNIAIHQGVVVCATGGSRTD
jgi:hypothetical protein